MLVKFVEISKSIKILEILIKYEVFEIILLYFSIL